MTETLDLPTFDSSMVALFDSFDGTSATIVGLDGTERDFAVVDQAMRQRLAAASVGDEVVAMWSAAAPDTLQGFSQLLRESPVATIGASGVTAADGTSVTVPGVVKTRTRGGGQFLLRTSQATDILGADVGGLSVVYARNVRDGVETAIFVDLVGPS